MHKCSSAPVLNTMAFSTYDFHQELDRGDVTLLILLDLLTVFDTISHPVWLS